MFPQCFESSVSHVSRGNCAHVPAHSVEREISDSEGDVSKVETLKRKKSIYTHFSKDRNCDTCLRSNEGSILRAEKFGDLITADHKVLIEASESRNNHRYAVVVQDLATQWIQSYPCKNQKPKVIHTDNSLEFGTSCEQLSWNHRTSMPYRSETNGTAERTIRRVKEGTLAVLLQSRIE